MGGSVEPQAGERLVEGTFGGSQGLHREPEGCSAGRGGGTGFGAAELGLNPALTS